MSVNVVYFHNGYQNGEINDNEELLDLIGGLNNASEAKQCVEEYFNNIVWVYKIIGEYNVYFTVEHSVDEIDAYIIKGYSLEELFQFIEDKRGYYSELKNELLEYCTI